MAEVIVTDKSFNSDIVDSKLPALVDFWAEWCGPCRIISPIVEELSKVYEGKLKVGKLNVDENPNTAGQYGVMSIPSLLFFKNGKVVKTIVGAQGREALKRAIEEVINQ